MSNILKLSFGEELANALTHGIPALLVLFSFPFVIITALFGLILTGGIFYSVGAAIYAKKGFKYHHMVWHIFVFFGVLTHYIGLCFFMY